MPSINTKINKHWMTLFLSLPYIFIICNWSPIVWEENINFSIDLPHVLITSVGISVQFSVLRTGNFSYFWLDFLSNSKFLLKQEMKLALKVKGVSFTVNRCKWVPNFDCTKHMKNTIKLWFCKPPLKYTKWMILRYRTWQWGLSMV